MTTFSTAGTDTAAAPATADVGRQQGHVDVIPSVARLAGLTVSVVPGADPAAVQVLAWLTATAGAVPDAVGVDRAGLAACGFDGKRGQRLVLPGDAGAVHVLAGVGDEAAVTATELRDAAAEVTRAVPHLTRFAIHVPAAGGVPVAAAAQAVVEGAVLGRYHFHIRAKDDTPELSELILVVGRERVSEAEEGARRGRVVAEAVSLGRDLANAPGGYLTATRLGEVARQVGSSSGLQVEVFDKAALLELGCGGLLGVNAGSVEPPTMVKLSYRPQGGAGAHLGLVGKGIMYDSGGIALKPADASHSQMKNDMTGAGVILAAMTALSALSGPAAVTGWLMCTDNMPSGSATRLGDVLTLRGGTRVEVLNTDAEGRLVMADALVLAVEDGVDAVVDVATLTGQCLRTLGTEIAGVIGNSPRLVDQVEAAGARADEPVWELPLAARYRPQLDSEIADLSNMAGPNAGSITAALFLAEFVDGVPWAHVDIAGTAQADAARTWRNKGATGFGTSLLIELATRFTMPPTGSES
jgi:leucyl aminopeptidase